MDMWRLIVEPPLPGSVNMARDYAVLKSVAVGGTPTIRLYRWSGPAITIGYFQVREDETDTAACARDGIGIIRRITGGGAVFHDGEITYSVAIPLADTRVSGTVLDTYRLLLSPLIEVLGLYSVESAFRPINDLTVQGKKISGSAQTRKEGVLLQHGTLLLSIDRNKLSRYLKISPLKNGNRAEPGITALDEWIDTDVADESFIGELNGRIADAFSLRLNVRLQQGSLTEEERAAAVVLEKTHFMNEYWNDKSKKNQLDVES